MWIEVKRQERINVHEAMEQALVACSADVPDGPWRVDLGQVRPPVIVHKRNRGEWLVTMRARDLARLVK